MCAEFPQPVIERSVRRDLQHFEQLARHLGIVTAMRDQRLDGLANLGGEVRREHDCPADGRGVAGLVFEILRKAV